MNTINSYHPANQDRTMGKKISVVIPIKEEEDNLGPLHQRLTEALSPLLDRSKPNPAGVTDYEIVIIDDGSRDRSYEILCAQAASDPRWKVVKLRRNFGQTPALRAGIDHATGDLIATMDGDLQNDPADIPMLLEKFAEGYDAVFGERANRQDAYLIRKFPSKIANWIIRKVTGSTTRDMGCTLRVLDGQIARDLPLYGEMHRFIPVLCQMQGARMIQVPVKHHARTAGVTKYNLTRTFRVVLDLITVKFLNSYLTRPMHFLGGLGMMFIVLGFASLIATLSMKTLGGIDMTGNPFLLLSMLLVLLGTQSIGLGILGEVLSRTYFESQGKRSYTVAQTLNLEAQPARKAA